jgi:hypothetical protein
MSSDYSDDRPMTDDAAEVPPESSTGLPQPLSLTPKGERTPSGDDKADQPVDQSGLLAQEAQLKQRIANLQADYDRLRSRQNQGVQADVERLVREGLRDLEQRKQILQREVEQLERRQERIQAEMRTSFAGVSQDLAIRVQGFKDYLVGSLQDLATTAEQLNLASSESRGSSGDFVDDAIAPPARSRGRSRGDDLDLDAPPAPAAVPTPVFAAQRFEEQASRIRSLLDQYRMRPDYYGPTWQLRRTFEPIHAEKISNWFFDQGGRGAVKTMGSRLQNVLVASAGASVLHTLYGNRLGVLVLANTPERLGEWRRGLQDCLGVSRTDFGANRGVVLFEDPGPMAQRAERMLEEGRMPLLLVDESENKISLSLLQFPLWLAFAPDPANPVPEYDYY